MIAFWLIAAALAAAALYVVLRPLVAPRGGAPLSRREANIAIYRDEWRELDADLAAGTLAREDYERSRLELEARLLEDLSTEEPIATRGGGRHAALALGVALPVLALVVYLAAGTPGALAPQTAMPTAAQVEGMVARLAAKLEENPGDVEGWKLLGRSYMVLGRYPQAVGAYAKAAERAPRDAQLLADFADALAMARGQRLAGEPERLIARALEIDPGNLKALALAGSAAFERQDYARAAELWSRMLPLVPAGSEEARSLAENVEEAKKLAAIGASSPDTASPHPGVRGTVRLAPALRQQVRPGDTVFVFARAAEGPAMPLAVLRARAADLPLQFALNDSMAMAQGLTVSAHPRVVVTARVSKSGSAK
ncbi:MAG TPA: c-type cytochrome biogenesis protein CcmI, partial [Burkholderiales bacterium]|nr:c-type cytochrome biogenesis protein CcmI [Burkholderiales bacterium]